MKKIKFFAMSVVGALLAFSCAQELDDALTMVSTELSVSNEGAELPLNFTTNTSWTIECDQTWVSFDYASGDAGENTVIATVEANDSYETREAVITIVAGTQKTVFNLTQSYSVEYTSEAVFNVSGDAQSLEYSVLTNAEIKVTVDEAAAEWITVAEDVEPKAAPSTSKLLFNIAKNSGFSPRTGYIYVSAANAVTRLAVVQAQAGAFVLTATPEVTFLGKSMDVYNGGVLNYDEYAVTFTTDEMSVTLALNYAMSESPLAALPAGEFVADAKGKHENGTFAVKKNVAPEKYYTTVVIAGEEKVIVDGTVSVSVAENVYTVNASLVDMDGLTYLYKYEGAVGTIADDSKGGEVSSLAYKNTYHTFFTSKANNWTATLYFAKQPAVFAGTSINRIELNLYGPTGEVTEKSVLPTGVFTLVEDKKVEGQTGEGYKDAQPGNFTLSAGNLGCVNYREYMGSPVLSKTNTVEITKNADGTYNFKFNITYDLTKKDASGTQQPYQSNVAFTEELQNIPLTATATDNQIYPMDDPKNGDVVTISEKASTYNVYDYGDVFNAGGSVAVMDFGVSGGQGLCGGALKLYLGLQMDVAYEHNKGYLNYYSNFPMPSGKYLWSATAVAGAKSILPLRIGTQKKSECYVQNVITGNKWNITGGNVTVGDKLTLDLTASNGLEGTEKVEFKIAGSCPISIVYGMDQKSNGSKISLAE